MSNVIEFSINGTDKFSPAMQKARAAMNVGVKAAVGFGAGAVAAFGVASKALIDVGDKTEQLGLRLGILLGNQQEGNKLFKEMADFASKVPFEYEKVMESATRLGGILKGGREEINQWMPRIADLAAATGFSIEEATEQVSRMLSAGAASADRFREQGVTAMLGFQSGVSYTAEQTKEQLLKMLDGPESRFKGAAGKLATTWGGIMSMISDKWFQFKQLLADAGVFNYFKAIAIVIDQYMGKALDTTKENAVGWGKTIINITKGMMEAIGFVADMVKGLEVTFRGVNLVLSYVGQGFWMLVQGATHLINTVAQFVPGVDKLSAAAMNFADNAMGAAIKRTNELKDGLAAAVAEGMPSEAIDEFIGKVDQVFAKLEEQKKKQDEAGGPTKGGAGMVVEEESYEAYLEKLNAKFLALDESLMLENERIMVDHEEKLMLLEDFFVNSEMSEEEHNQRLLALNEQYQAQRAATNKLALKGSYDFGKAIRQMEYTDAIGHFSNMLGALAETSSTAFKIQKAAALYKAVVSLPSAVMQSFENGGGYPWGLIPAGLMLATGLQQIGKIKGTNFAGQAHAGMTNIPREGTYMLDGGERVLAPEQNRDLTSFLNGGGSSSSVQITELHMHIMENVTSAEALMHMDERELDELVAVRFIDSLNRLNGKGVRPDFTRTSEEI